MKSEEKLAAAAYLFINRYVGDPNHKYFAQLPKDGVLVVQRGGLAPFEPLKLATTAEVVERDEASMNAASRGPLEEVKFNFVADTEPFHTARWTTGEKADGRKVAAFAGDWSIPGKGPVFGETDGFVEIIGIIACRRELVLALEAAHQFGFCHAEFLRVAYEKGYYK